MGDKGGGAIVLTTFALLIFTGYVAGAAVTQFDLLKCKRADLTNATCSQVNGWFFYREKGETK